MDTSVLVRMYAQMQLVRRAEERVIEQYHWQNREFAEKRNPPHTIKCPTHLSIGQEASAVGLCSALDVQDVLVSSHRCHAHYIAKGGSLNAMMAELFGRTTGCAHGKGGSMHLVDTSVGMMGSSAIVGGAIPLALGMALPFKMRGEAHVSVACFGDAAVEQGVFHESMHYAALRKLPVIFFCENNGYATLSPFAARQHVPIYARAASYGMAGIRVDGNNVVEVCEVVREAASTARAGDGPTLIECETYRWIGHVGPDRDAGTGPRTKEELESWIERCPITRLRKQLELRVSKEVLVQADADVERKLDDAVAFAKASPSPTAEDLFHGV